MTSELPFEDEITSSEQFEAALETLLRAALENDVDPKGAWEYRSNDGAADWEVMVYEIQEQDA